jgi:hypothetical protein
MSGIIAQNTLDNTGLIKSPAAGGAWNFISKTTASSDDTISITSGLDSTYKEYLFTFNNMHFETDSTDFFFNFSIDGGTNYNVTKTSSMIRTYHGEDGASAASVYYSGGDVDTNDLAQSTAFQVISGSLASNSDDSTCAKLQIFNPSSTVFAKHYLLDTNMSHVTPRSIRFIIAGYANTTSAINAIQFKPLSDAIDSGDICLYGLTT